jgi:hypothetical protein
MDPDSGQTNQCGSMRIRNHNTGIKEEEPVMVEFLLLNGAAG